jgi:hypothetical protein
MPDWLVSAATVANLGSLLAWGVLLVSSVRRWQREEQAQFARWKAIEEEQARAWSQRRKEVQAACPICGLATPQDDA